MECAHIKGNERKLTGETGLMEMEMDMNMAGALFGNPCCGCRIWGKEQRGALLVGF